MTTRKITLNFGRLWDQLREVLDRNEAREAFGLLKRHTFAFELDADDVKFTAVDGREIGAATKPAEEYEPLAWEEYRLFDAAQAWKARATFADGAGDFVISTDDGKRWGIGDSDDDVMLVISDSETFTSPSAAMVHCENANRAEWEARRGQRGLNAHASQPAWCKKPTCEGWWAHANPRFFIGGCLMWYSSTNIETGKIHDSPYCYGPIPEPPKSEVNQ